MWTVLLYTTIHFIKAHGDYIKVHTGNGLQVTYASLNRMEALLPAQQFMRIHKSYIINLGSIQFVESNLVRIFNQELPIGLTYKDALYARLGQE